MTSVVGICNQAIARTGQTATISALTESSTEAKLCNTHYEQCRDAVIQAFPWGFSTKRITLALIDDDEPVSNWECAYHYPSNCLRVFSIVAASNNPKLSQAVPFEVANYGDEKVILTNEADAEVIYAYRVTDVTLFPPLVIDAISALIAKRIALPLTSRPDIQKLCAEEYLQAIHEAAQIDMNESNPGEAPDCDLITGRE